MMRHLNHIIDEWQLQIGCKMIKCNNCWTSPSAGPAYRTTCRHLLCDKCAKEAFTSHCYCPVCNAQLRAQDVTEFLVGVPPIGMHETIFQIAFQDLDWNAVTDNTTKVAFCMTELASFVQSQLLLEQQKEASVRGQLEQSHDTYKNDSVHKSTYIISSLYSSN